MVNQLRVTNTHNICGCLLPSNRRAAVSLPVRIGGFLSSLMPRKEENSITQRGDWGWQAAVLCLVIVRQCWGVFHHCCGSAEVSLTFSRKRLLKSIKSPNVLVGHQAGLTLSVFVREARKDPTIALVLLQLLFLCFIFPSLFQLRCVWLLTSFSDVTSCSRRVLYPPCDKHFVMALSKIYFWES